VTWKTGDRFVVVGGDLKIRGRHGTIINATYIDYTNSSIDESGVFPMPYALVRLDGEEYDRRVPSPDWALRPLDVVEEIAELDREARP